MISGAPPSMATKTSAAAHRTARARCVTGVKKAGGESDPISLDTELA